MARQKRESQLGTFFLTQQIEPEYWKWENLGKANDENVTNKMRQYLKDKNYKAFVWYLSCLLDKTQSPDGDFMGDWEIEEMHYIIHDKDVRKVWDEGSMQMVLEVKAPHIHIAVKFKKGKNKGATLSQIARLTGVAPEYIEPPKSGRYSWDNYRAYLIHAKDQDKFQYSYEEVVTMVGKDYASIYHECIDQWKRAAVKKQNTQAKKDVDWLEHQILTGQVVRSQIFLTDEYYQIYSQEKRRIDDAFDTYGQRKMYRAIQALENGEFKTKVVYVTGKPGVGKTRYVNDLIKRLREENPDWGVCKTASSNPVDDYNGEEILFMDDVRGNTMRATDWLKLLDPWNISPSSARYRNKIVSARIIFITATMTPWEFFYYSKGVGSGTAQEEAVDQFLRRLHAIVKVIRFGEVSIQRALLDGKEHNYPVPISGTISDALDEYGYGQAVKNLSSNIAIEDDEELTNLSYDEKINRLADELSV